MTALRRCLLVAGFAWFIASPVAAQESWGGETVLTRSDSAKVGHVDDKGKLIGGAAVAGFGLYVNTEKDGWLLLVNDWDHAKMGWIRVTDAIKLEDAITFFAERIKKNPKDADALARRGVAFMLKEKNEDAIQDFDNALRLDPKNVGAYRGRATIWQRKNDSDRTIADLSNAIRLDPESVTTRKWRAQLSFAMGDTDKAIADLTEVIRLDPKNAYNYHWRGCYWAEKDNDKAIADFTESIRLEPHKPFDYPNRAGRWLAQKDYDKAIADFSEALKYEDPQNRGGTFSSRGNAYFMKKDYARALNDYARAEEISKKLELAATYTQHAMLLASCADAKFRDGKKAVELATTAAKLAVDNKDLYAKDNGLSFALDAHAALAAAHAETGDFTEAVRWQERAMQDPQFRDDPDMRRRLELYRAKKPYRQE